MPSYFTQFWDRNSVARGREWSKQAGRSTRAHTAGELFRSRGVHEGDRVYIIGLQRGLLLLISAMDVSQIVDYETAKRLLDYDPYEASEHLLGTGTENHFDRTIHPKVVAKIRFGNGKPPKFVRRGVLDQQTFRGIRRLTADSAALLDAILEIETPLSRDVEETYIEGAARQVTHDVFERDRAARSACIEHHGTRCAVCSMSFAEVYGAEFGRDFIHVHHLRALADVRKKHKVDPVEDLIPVCPNCHAMLHLRGALSLGLDDLRDAMQIARRRVGAC